MAVPLPPTPLVNRDVPVITSAGGSSAAYKDPNSPESIMKKTTQTEAQSITDTRFDVPPDAFTNYMPMQHTPLLPKVKGYNKPLLPKVKRYNKPLLLLSVIVIAFLLFLLATHRIRGSMRTVILTAVVLLLVLSIALKKKNES